MVFIFYTSEKKKINVLIDLLIFKSNTIKVQFFVFFFNSHQKQEGRRVYEFVFQDWALQ